jgi:hypothetical protein
MDLYKEISKVAYELYEKRGKAENRDLDNWLEAEKIVKARYSVKEKSVSEKKVSAAKKTVAKAKKIITELFLKQTPR